MAKLSIIQQIANLMAQIAKEESWMEHYAAIGVAAPEQETKVYNLRLQLQTLREIAERTVQS